MSQQKKAGDRLEAELTKSNMRVRAFLGIDAALRLATGPARSLDSFGKVRDALTAGQAQLSREPKDAFSDIWAKFTAASLPCIEQLQKRYPKFQQQLQMLRMRPATQGTAASVARLQALTQKLATLRQQLGVVDTSIAALGPSEPDPDPRGGYHRDPYGYGSPPRRDPPAGTRTTAIRQMSTLQNLITSFGHEANAELVPPTVPDEFATTLRDQVAKLQQWLTGQQNAVAEIQRNSIPTLSLVTPLPFDQCSFFGVSMSAMEAAAAGGTSPYVPPVPSAPGGPVLEDVINDAIRSLRNTQAQAGLSLDPSKSSLSDYLTACVQRSENPHWPLAAELGEDAAMPDDMLEKLSSGMLSSATVLYAEVGAALIDALGPVYRILGEWVTDASGRANAQALTPAITMAQGVAAAMQQVNNELLMGAAGAVPSQPVIELNRRLSSALTESSPLLAALRGGGVALSSAKGLGTGFGSGSGSGSGFGSGSGRAGGQGGKEGGDKGFGVAGFLYRSLDTTRLARSVHTAEMFRDSLKDSAAEDHAAAHSKQLKDACDKAVSMARADADLGTGAAAGAIVADPEAAARAAKAQARRRAEAAGKGVVSAVRRYASSMRMTVRSYVSKHDAFVGRVHGDAMRYVNYWAAMPREMHSDEQRTMLEHHAAAVKDVAAAAKEMLMKLHKMGRDETSKAALLQGVPLEQDDAARLAAETVRLGDWTLAQTRRVEEMYLRGHPTLLESLLSDRRVVWLYALKLLRLLIARGALAIASRAFAQYYRRQVHQLDNDPPAPAWMVAIAVLTDAAMHSAVAVVLLGARHVFSSPNTGDFPIDGELITMWGADYAGVSAVVLVLSLLISEVVRSKKYFRYKYEGERGIRAMRDMMFYVYCVALPMPFYRLV